MLAVRAHRQREQLRQRCGACSPWLHRRLLRLEAGRVKASQRVEQEPGARRLLLEFAACRVQLGQRQPERQHAEHGPRQHGSTAGYRLPRHSRPRAVCSRSETPTTNSWSAPGCGDSSGVQAAPCCPVSSRSAPLESATHGVPWSLKPVQDSRARGASGTSTGAGARRGVQPGAASWFS